MAIDLFVGLCVLSRALSLVREVRAGQQSAVTIAEVFTRQARRRLMRNVRGMTINEDKVIEALAGSILDKGVVDWDVT